MVRSLVWPLLLSGCLLVSPAAAEDPAGGATPAEEGAAVSPQGAPAALTFVSSTAVTPTAGFSNGDFVRIYQRGTKVLVTFSTTLSSALVPGTCPTPAGPTAAAYVYREFNEDMTPTGRDGVITCSDKGGDNGSLLVGDKLYLALSGVDDPVLDGWNLSMYDARTWSTLPAPPTPPLAGPFTHKLDCGKRAGDPMLALVNGLIDIDGKYLGPNCCGDEHTWPSWCIPSPTNNFTTHHNFFDPATFNPAPCPPSCPMILPVPPVPGHIDMDSLYMVDGNINLLASSGSSIFGDLILIRLDPAWNYLGSNVLRPHAWGPEGVAQFGGHHYVSFLDSSACGDMLPCEMNARLAVFDEAWRAPPIEEIALTSFAKGSGMTAQKATLLLVDDKLYAAYVASPATDVTAAQVSVALFHIGPVHRPRRHLHGT